MSTTSLLIRKFYSDRTSYKGYHRLRILELGGFVESRLDSYDRKYLWTLTKIGFEQIEGRLLTLKEQGYRSEAPGHDLLAAAVHLGDAAFDEESPIEFFSEQELRRVAPWCYPDWVPKSDVHRPDGYWRAAGGERQRTIALEVELKEKDVDSYRALGGFYENQSRVERVLWLVRRTSAALRIQQHITKPGRDTSKHNFLSFDAFLERGWSAKIELGADTGKTVNELLGYSSVIGGLSVPVQYSLNLKKSHKNAAGSLTYSVGDFSHR